MIKPKEKYIFPTRQCLEILQADITLLKADAIVNAANAYLEHGGGVAEAIVRRGGNTIQVESREWVRKYGPVPHKKPAYTSAGDLGFKYVIHAVGPKGGDSDGDDKLRSAINGCLELAEELKLSSIAFPAISTGIFGFPKNRAASIFFHAVNNYYELHADSKIELVQIVLYDKYTLGVFINEYKIVYKKQGI